MPATPPSATRADIGVRRNTLASIRPNSGEAAYPTATTPLATKRSAA